ncbi:MAG TPA: hypothetical protein VI653_05510, partial [Steroidobacteraceae bacterium]
MDVFPPPAAGRRRPAPVLTWALAILGLACTPAVIAAVLTVAASAVPHAEILEFIKPQLKAEGVDLRVK